MKNQRITAARAIAEVLGCDLADMAGSRYQSTRTKQAIYIVGGDYYAAHKKPTDEVGQPWEKCGEFRGVTVWESKVLEAEE